MRHHLLRSVIAAALLLLLVPARPWAGQPAGLPPEPDTIAMDFMAVGPDGRHVRDLRPTDISLKVGGAERPVHALEFVEVSTPGALERTGALTPPLPLPFASNLLADSGRIVMIVVNHESIRAGKERPAREAAARFLGTLSPRDLVGLETMPRGGIRVDPTRDHEQIRSALQRISGQAPQTAGQDLPGTPRIPGVSAAQVAISDRACSARLTLNALSGLMDAMSVFEGPKTVVFISSGLATPTRDAPLTGPPGRCELKPEYYEEVGVAAAKARARFYVIQPNDLVTDPASTAITDMTASRFSGTDDQLAGLQNLAGVTSGELFRLTGTADTVFQRVAAESAGYYIASFQPLPSERNGLSHRIEVRTTRPGVELRYQPRLTVPKADGRKDPKFLSPHDMLRGARRFRTLPLRAMAFASGMPDSNELKVVAVAEPMDPMVRITSAAMALIDSKNKLVKQWTAAQGDLARSQLVAAFPASPGTYRLRVAAIDAAGRHGTVEYMFAAELATAGSLKLSAIALGVARNDDFEPRMLFGDEPAAIAYLEMYGRSPAAVVRLELADTVDGPALVSVPARLTETQDPDRRVAIGALPITSLFPGDYIVRAVVTNDGKPLGRATRTLRKVLVR